MQFHNSIFFVVAVVVSTCADVALADVSSILSEGDAAFSKQEYNAAVRHYTAAIGESRPLLLAQATHPIKVLLARGAHSILYSWV